MAILRRSWTKPSKVSPQEYARWAFFAFVMVQTPTFMQFTSVSPKGVVFFSPLQFAAAVVYEKIPESKPFCELLLLPGTWVQQGFVKYYGCLIKEKKWSSDKCDHSALSDISVLLDRTELSFLVTFANAPELKEKEWLALGCLLAVVAAFACVFVPVKASFVAFIILGYVVWQTDLIALPPGIMMVFLVTFGMFNDKSEWDKEQEKQKKEEIQAGEQSDSQTPSLSASKIKKKKRKDASK